MGTLVYFFSSKMCHHDCHYCVTGVTLQPAPLHLKCCCWSVCVLTCEPIAVLHSTCTQHCSRKLVLIGGEACLSLKTTCSRWVPGVLLGGAFATVTRKTCGSSLHLC
ncbi:hypothetical protein SKAU_G00267450 [Synaphobranchus kaupii]|uniref:Uncharacterized protein n=1 Tax=Synaphobranchus kaupii TaxID=118154 RepID=A0A9Q1EZQ2_SYNKA|nr:hypothetical protein SKAU_G00267450 [Synaphobranchus kaupii]